MLAEHPCLSQRAAIGLHTGQAKCGLADGSHASHRATWQPWELQGSNSHLAQEALQTVGQEAEDGSMQLMLGTMHMAAGLQGEKVWRFSSVCAITRCLLCTAGTAGAGWAGR